ncbi:hypothetical protein Tco_1271358 [Tanacetum coccineum]
MHFGRSIPTIPAVPATVNSPEVPERTAVETVSTMSPENKDHYESEKEAIHLILTGIGDEIYSTVDACKIAHEIHKGKEIPTITPPSESSSEEDSDPEQAQKDKDLKQTVKDSTYHKEKMLLCKQAEKGVQLKAEQSNWLADTDEEIDETRFRNTFSYNGKDP